MQGIHNETTVLLLELNARICIRHSEFLDYEKCSLQLTNLYEEAKRQGQPLGIRPSAKLYLPESTLDHYMEFILYSLLHSIVYETSGLLRQRLSSQPGGPPLFCHAFQRLNQIARRHPNVSLMCLHCFHLACRRSIVWI